MASHRIETYCQRLAFPIGYSSSAEALIALSARVTWTRFRTSGATPVATGVTSMSSNGTPTAMHFNRVHRWNRTT